MSDTDPASPRSTGPYESGIPELIIEWLSQATLADVVIFGEIVKHFVAAELDERVAS